jgi:hypothetical protein
VAPGEPADNEIQVDDGDQPGAGVTARLLLALTALYVQRSNHTAEEQQQYTELALRLIDKVGLATRAAIAARLQHHPDAPPAVIARLDSARLSRNGPDGVSSHSAEEQQAEDHLARDHLEANPHFGFEPCLGLADREQGVRELAQVESESESGSSTPQPPVPVVRQPAPLMPEFGEAFFAAAAPERRRMLSEIAATDTCEAAPCDGRRFHVRIDTAPWQGRTGAFARDLARLIDAPKGLCDRILNDPSGEPLVVAARAAGMPVAVLQRILLLVCPETNHSVQRVYELTELYHGLGGGTAHALLAAWRDAAKPDDDATPPPPAPVTNLRARLGALNARIEKQASRENTTGTPHPPIAGGGSGRGPGHKL